MVGKVCSKTITLTFQREGAERRRDRGSLENFYYKAIYQALQTPDNYAQKATESKGLKAKVIRLHSAQRYGILLDNGETDRMLGEDLSIHHFIQAIKRQKARSITHICDREGTLHTSAADIRRSFVIHMRHKYDHIPIDQASIDKLVDPTRFHQRHMHHWKSP